MLSSLAARFGAAGLTLAASLAVLRAVTIRRTRSSADDGRRRVAVVVTGSVAAVKAPAIAESISPQRPGGASSKFFRSVPGENT